jgi:hypothetical protein
MRESTAPGDVVKRWIFRKVYPPPLLVPIINRVPGDRIVTRFCDQSAAGLAVAPTKVTEGKQS